MRKKFLKNCEKYVIFYQLDHYFLVYCTILYYTNSIKNGSRY